MWFAARILFESSVKESDERVLQEESIRLIQAENEAQAHAKAAALGLLEEHQYPNEQGETVNWKYVEILEIQDLCEANVFDGMEVFSRLKWRILALSQCPPAGNAATLSSSTGLVESGRKTAR